MPMDPGTPMDPEEHPAHNMPTATDDHDGTVLSPMHGVTRTGYPMTFRPGIKSFPPSSMRDASNEKG